MGATVVGNPPEAVSVFSNPSAEPEELETEVYGPIPDPDPSGSYAHHQTTPAATWTVVHNLNTKPDMALFIDPDLSERVFTSVSYPDLNTAVVEWDSAETGWAYAR